MGKNVTHMSINDDNAIDHLTYSEASSYSLLTCPDIEILREVYSRYIKSQLKHGREILLVLLHYEPKKGQQLLEIFPVILILFTYHFCGRCCNDGGGK